MNQYKYGWNIDVTKYIKGTFLLGLNFNTNTEFGKREYYISVYLGKYCVTIGKFFKQILNKVGI